MLVSLYSVDFCLSRGFYDFFKLFLKCNGPDFLGVFTAIVARTMHLFRMLPSRAALCPSPGSVKHYVFLCIVD